MYLAAAEGFALGGSLIVAIGAQNAFILRQGLLREHVFALCLFASLADASLILLGVMGVGTLVQSSPKLIYWVSLAGACFLFVYGLIAWKRALHPEALKTEKKGAANLKIALAALFAFTFLNPHVYLDTVVLLGGISGGYSGTARTAFALGAMLASFVWFFALGYGARWLAPLFSKPVAWRVLDFLIGLIMFAIAFSLVARVS